MPYHADYERRIAQLEQDMANLRLLIDDLRPRVESIESDLAAIMQEEPEAYDEHGFTAPKDHAWEKGSSRHWEVPVYQQMENPGC